MLDLIPIAAVRALVVLNYSWCGVRLDHWRREVGLTNDYPRLDESLSVLVEVPISTTSGSQSISSL